jgi:hypothetical protein
MSATTEIRPDAGASPMSWGRTLATATGLTALVALILLAFSWPALTADPHGVEVAIAGPEQAVTQVEPMLAEQAGDTFDITTLTDRAAAVEAIEEREIAGAIVLGEEPELLTASANGTANLAVAQLAAPLQQALTAQAEAAGQPAAMLTVTDVVPYSADDPNGSLLASMSLPLVFGGMIGGIGISLTESGTSRRIAGVLLYSTVGSVVLTGILQGWYGALQGNFLVNAGAFALAIAAIAAPIIGFVSLFGRAGIAVGPVVMMLFANPISGAQLPSQFLPGAWGAIGQHFPPGAAATLVRELTYFPDATMTSSWLVLIAWTVGGLLLALVGHSRTRTAARPTAGADEGARELVAAAP